MWVQVLFDLPVVEDKERQSAVKFRKHLLDLGFEMSQFSVYLKYVSSKETAETLIKKIELKLPPNGRVHILVFTDKQYENIKTFIGRKKFKNKVPEQYELF